MSQDDDLDELLAAMERRAERLESRKRQVQMTDTFGRMPSALSRTASSLLSVGDAIGENYEVEQVLDERGGSLDVGEQDGDLLALSVNGMSRLQELVGETRQGGARLGDGGAGVGLGRAC